MPDSDAEAAARFEKWQGKDPFPAIAPALLNSADLFDYIAETGMIYPFEIDPNKVDRNLKPASCGIHLGGECLYWTYSNGDGQGLVEKKQTLDGETVLKIPRNAIVYASLAPTFRLPDYIAARFNLGIKYIYRGLLVGTGPLVDPGFKGQLQLPIHNLTASDCHIPTRDIVVWMEFTKLSTRDEWERNGSEPRYGRYVPFPERKQRPDLATYLKEANDGEPIVSSIPAVFQQTTAAAEASAEEARKARRASVRFQLATALSAVTVLLAFVAYLATIQSSTSSDADSALQRSNTIEAELNQVQDRLKHLVERQNREVRQAARASR